MSADPTTSPWFRRLATRGSVALLGTALALAAVAVYANSFHVPFLLDDWPKIIENASIRDLRHLGAVLSPGALTIRGRPLLNLSFALNYRWSGEQVWSYHVVNLAIHLLAGLTLAGVVRRTLLTPGLGERWGKAALPLSGVIAALWILHPLQTESVTYLSQRAESLMGLFYLLTLYCFIRGVGANGVGPPFAEASAGEKAASRRSLLWFGASWLACFFGMATKEVMVTAPFLVLLYDRAYLSPSFRAAAARRRGYYAGLAASWLFLAFLMNGAKLAEQGAGFHNGVSAVQYGMTELKVIAEYVRLAVWPHPLVFDYGPQRMVTVPAQAAPFALGVLAMAIAAVIAWRRSKPLGFVACSFFILLSPTSSFVPVALQPMAESRMYLPLASLVTLVALGVYAWIGRVAFAALALAAALLGAATFGRNQDYRSALSLWAETAAQRPASSRAQNNLGNELAKLPGRQAEAAAHFRQALQIDPNDAEAHNNLATIVAKLPGGQAEALAHYGEAVRIKPNFAEAHNNLAAELSKIPGRQAEAVAQATLAVQLKPDFAEAHYNLASVLAGLPGRATEAIEHDEAALRLKPDYPEAEYNLGCLFLGVPGRLPQAIAHFEQALRLRPTYANAEYNLAVALAKSGRRDEAIRHFERAFQLDPGNRSARENAEGLRAQAAGRRK